MEGSLSNQEKLKKFYRNLLELMDEKTKSSTISQQVRGECLKILKKLELKFRDQFELTDSIREIIDNQRCLLSIGETKNSQQIEEQQQSQSLQLQWLPRHQKSSQDVAKLPHKERPEHIQQYQLQQEDMKQNKQFIDNVVNRTIKHISGFKKIQVSNGKALKKIAMEVAFIKYKTQDPKSKQIIEKQTFVTNIKLKNPPQKRKRKRDKKM